MSPTDSAANVQKLALSVAYSIACAKISYDRSLAR